MESIFQLNNEEEANSALTICHAAPGIFGIYDVLSCPGDIAPGIFLAHDFFLFAPRNSLIPHSHLLSGIDNLAEQIFVFAFLSLNITY